MNVADLSRDEKLALVALTELAVIADRDVTDNEVEKVEEIVEALGEETFQELAEEAETRFAKRNDLRDFLKRITAQDARETIYSAVLAESLADRMPHEQTEFLDWLAREWQVPVTLESGENV